MLGVLLAGAAAALIYFKLPGAGAAFTGAVLAIVGGIAGLAVYHQQEKKRREKEQDQEFEPRTEVYREAACKPDRALIDALAQIAQHLTQPARDKGWELDWDAHQKHHDLADKALAQNNLSAALRETCRALRPLTDALHRHRHKEEKFQPNWDKAKKG